MKRTVQGSQPLDQDFDVEVPEVDAFIADIVAVYKKHNMTISHEDGHGGFLIAKFDEHNIRWLEQAADCRKAPWR